LMVLGFELRASGLLGRYTTTWVTLPAPDSIFDGQLPVFLVHVVSAAGGSCSIARCQSSSPTGALLKYLSTHGVDSFPCNFFLSLAKVAAVWVGDGIMGVKIHTW
jgi:hypothetical protein